MRYIFVVLFTILSINAFAQENFEPTSVHKPDKDYNLVFTSVTQMPRYVGGDAEMMKFISKNLKVESVSKEKGLGTMVIVRFVITKTGKINNIEVLRGDSTSMTKAAVEVVKQMPDWIPGQQDSIPVDVYYTLPIRVRLKSE